MNTDTNTKTKWGLALAAAFAFAALPVLTGCQQESVDDGGAEAPPAAMDSAGDDHGHEHAESEDAHGHEHAEGEEDHGHSHDAAEQADADLTTPHGVLHAIAKVHEAIETAQTDQQLLDVHHAPFEINDLFTTLRPMIELSEENAAKYDELHAKIGRAASLIEEHSHENDVQMVRTLVEKLNADIEALNKVAAPDHVH